MNSDTANQTEQPKTYPEIAQVLIDNAYTVLPIKKEDKAPAIKGWMKPEYKPPLVGFHNCGIAIKTGIGEYPVIAVDIDTTDENFAKEIQDKISEIVGSTIYRIGQYPKMIMLYRLVTAA
ncbi:MAG: hypothetical protein FWD13_07635 [Treponema sp.]|nr:hypothetical protein [Treponema sp.]